MWYFKTSILLHRIHYKMSTFDFCLNSPALVDLQENKQVQNLIRNKNTLVDVIFVIELTFD